MVMIPWLKPANPTSLALELMWRTGQQTAIDPKSQTNPKP